MTSWSNSDFEALSWHDDTVYAIAFRVGDPRRDDWRSELVFDIDHIAEWVSGGDTCRFRVAPAQLVFEGVTDPAFDFAWQATPGYQVVHTYPSIDRIERVRTPDAKVYLDRPYYRWSIELNSPQGGTIGFGAVDFSMSLQAEPVLCDEQQLGLAARERT